MLSSSGAASTQLKTSIDIIAVHPTSTNVYVWIKNVGSADILAIEKSDVFLQTPTDFIRMSYNETPGWAFAIEDGTPTSTWKPGYTLKVTITLESALQAGDDYVFKFTTNNGVSDEESFSL